MNDCKCERNNSSEADRTEAKPDTQVIFVFQQNGSAESKIQGIRKFGQDQFTLEVISIDEALPPVVDDGSEYLPASIRASLVLDFLKHPDLSEDLAVLCRDQKVPMVASGKKLRIEGAMTPLT